MKALFLTAALCLTAAPALSCDLPYYSDPSGAVTVQLSGNGKPFYVLEKRNGAHRICLAEHSFGMDLYVVTCDDETFFNMRVVDDKGGISYDEIILAKQCNG